MIIIESGASLSQSLLIVLCLDSLNVSLNAELACVEGKRLRQIVFTSGYC